MSRKLWDLEGLYCNSILTALKHYSPGALAF